MIGFVTSTVYASYEQVYYYTVLTFITNPYSADTTTKRTRTLK